MENFTVKFLLQGFVSFVFQHVYCTAQRFCKTHDQLNRRNKRPDNSKLRPRKGHKSLILLNPINPAREVKYLVSSFLHCMKNEKPLHGGAHDRNRTYNLNFTKVLLCQLSYVGIEISLYGKRRSQRSSLMLASIVLILELRVTVSHPLLATNLFIGFLVRGNNILIRFCYPFLPSVYFCTPLVAGCVVSCDCCEGLRGCNG